MKKIPTLFERRFDNHRIIDILPNVHPGMEWVLEGEGTATEKIDGSCCCVMNGIFYKRYDAKNGKTPPPDAIPCDDPDPITGHWPHWLAIDPVGSGDKWFWKAWNTAFEASGCIPPDGTYEIIGPHFNTNPYDFTTDILVPHGIHVIEVERSFEGIKKYLEEHEIEGIVFWKDGEPQCKIKRTDFGLKWPLNK